MRGKRAKALRRAFVAVTGRAPVEAEYGVRFASRIVDKKGDVVKVLAPDERIAIGHVVRRSERRHILKLKHSEADRLIGMAGKVTP